MPYGHVIGTADDHMHIDLGYVTIVPREMSEDLAPTAPVPRTAIERRRVERRVVPPPPAREPDPPTA